MHSLTERLLTYRGRNQPALLPYLMAGDGGFARSEALIRLYEASGAAAIEIGVPFSDPVADGPVIQAAGLRALAEGTTLRGVLKWLGTLDAPKVPRVLMTYLNPVLRMGIDAFFTAAAGASVHAVIIPDLPLEEMDLLTEASAAADLPLIPLVSPGTGLARLDGILAHTDGFVYAVTVNGVTGPREVFPEALRCRLAELRRHSRLPVIAGFGISTIGHMRQLRGCCDGFIIGSRLVEMAARGEDDAIAAFLAEASALQAPATQA